MISIPPPANNRAVAEGTVDTVGVVNERKLELGVDVGVVGARAFNSNNVVGLIPPPPNKRLVTVGTVATVGVNVGIIVGTAVGTVVGVIVLNNNDVVGLMLGVAVKICPVLVG